MYKQFELTAAHEGKRQPGATHPVHFNRLTRT